jgi:D-glycero-D-manno-heptose 1,7-bisphosphate phosphatase
VARLNRAGVRTVLITNQRWMSRPDAVVDDYRATHARLIELLAEHGARLDAAYHCPHERGACDCRKPAPGMLRRAAADLRLDPARAVMIGDAESDMAAGRAAGTATMLLSAESMNVGPLRHRDADAVVPDLGSGVELLLASQRA